MTVVIIKILIVAALSTLVHCLVRCDACLQVIPAVDCGNYINSICTFRFNIWCVLQGCMKSGQVLTDRRYKWFEPEYWRFGEAAGAEGQINYMRHASGQIYGLSGPVAKYIGRNGPILHRFANEDVTLGAWLVGLEITHVDERRLCCDSAEKCNAQVHAVLWHGSANYRFSTLPAGFSRWRLVGKLWHGLCFAAA